MPMRAPSICGCGRVFSPDKPCGCKARATAQRKAKFDKSRPSASSRGYDSTWRKAAREFLARPGNDLCGCGAPAVLVRHLISIKSRPDLRMDQRNWAPGCHRCNARDTANER